jgi:hypothetical protein
MIIIGCDFHTRYQQIAMAGGRVPRTINPKTYLGGPHVGFTCGAVDFAFFSFFSHP